MFKLTLAVWSLRVLKLAEQTHWMIDLEYKIEIVRYTDEEINAENVATDWL
jgi:hypothetical protein